MQLGLPLINYFSKINFTIRTQRFNMNYYQYLKLESLVLKVEQGFNKN